MSQSVKTIFREFFCLILKLLMLVCLIYMVLQQYVCGCVGCACAKEEKSATEAHQACPKTQLPSVPQSWLMSWIFWQWETLMFPCHGLCFCLRTVLVHWSFIPSNDLLQEILTRSLKQKRWVRDAPIRFSLWSSVCCPGTHLLHTFLYPKRLWTMSQIVPCERLNCSSNSLSNTRR